MQRKIISNESSDIVRLLDSDAMHVRQGDPLERTRVKGRCMQREIAAVVNASRGEGTAGTLHKRTWGQRLGMTTICVAAGRCVAMHLDRPTGGDGHYCVHEHDEGNHCIIDIGQCG